MNDTLQLAKENKAKIHEMIISNQPELTETVKRKPRKKRKGKKKKVSVERQAMSDFCDRDKFLDAIII